MGTYFPGYLKRWAYIAIDGSTLDLPVIPDDLEWTTNSKTYLHFKWTAILTKGVNGHELLEWTAIPKKVRSKISIGCILGTSL